MNGKKGGIILLFILVLFSSCKKEENTTVSPGNVRINFSFCVDDSPLVLDNRIYHNAAGNLYEVNDVQFFISDITLINQDGTICRLNNEKGIHYVDFEIPATLQWNVSDDIPAGNYKSLRFVFGINSKQNITGLFTDAPENLMAWPSTLGGGYHYMKINGKWENEGVTSNLNFHTGIGQRLDQSDNTVHYTDNSFEITLQQPYNVVSKECTTLELKMNLNSWFTTPYDYDFNVWGGSIMQNQEAQEVIRANGYDVFTLSIK